MKYSEHYSGNGKKLGTGFYILVACCFLVIGAALWFAVSNYKNSVPNAPIDPNSGNNSGNSSYNSNITDEPRQPLNSENVAQSAESEPYKNEEQNDEKVSPGFTMPVEGEILKDFSLTELVFSATMGDMRIHSGVDIACKNGTSVSACADGKVKSVDIDPLLGTTVVIEHTGEITVKYSALDNLSVKSGDKVKMGDIIGVTTTVPAECNEENHLHLEAFKNGEPVSPLDTLKLR